MGVVANGKDNIMYCTICGGDTIEIMGVLGNITWGRCQDCGMDIQVQDVDEPAPVFWVDISGAVAQA